MTLIVAAAILDSLDHPRMLLAAQRSYPADIAGLWEFPGGKVEPDESPEDAVLREIREELGCEIVLGERVVAPASSVDSEGDSQCGEGDSQCGEGGSQCGEGGSQCGEGGGDWPLARPGVRMRLWYAQVAPHSAAPSAGDSHSQIRWVPLESAMDLPWIPADLEIVAAVSTRGTNY